MKSAALLRDGADADDQPVAERRRVLDHVQVPVGHRVEQPEKKPTRVIAQALACRGALSKGRAGSSQSIEERTDG